MYMGITEWMLGLIFVIIISLHTLAAFLKCRITKPLKYVNIGLHIVTVPLFLLAGGSLNVVALVFMSDFLVYLLLNLAALHRDRERGDESDV